MSDAADYAQRWERAPKHVVSAAAVVVNESNELLLVRSPIRGWEMPGGQVEQGETLRGAAIRETLEESGVVIEIVGFCGVFQTVTRSVCNFLFLGKPTGGSPRLSDESLEVAWVAMPRALELVTFPTFRQRIELSLDRSSWPFLVEFTSPLQRPSVPTWRSTSPPSVAGRCAIKPRSAG